MKSANGAWLMAALVALSACGKSRRTDDSESGGNAGEAAGGRGGSAGGTSSGGSGATAGAVGTCVVVRRIGCCNDPVAVTASEFAADECWLPFDVNLTDGNVLERCEATRPADCVPEPCAERVPPSRVAVPDPSGVCHFVDECSTDDDCTLATQCCSCCACPEPMPTSRVRAESCVVGAGEASPGSVCARCPGGFCQDCRHDGTLGCHATPGGLRRCDFGAPLPDDACTVDRPCAGDFSFNVCSSPGDPVCGGPPPPDDECSTDSDCAAAGDATICVPSGHCGQLRCEPGCTSDAACTEAEVCSANHHCEPAPCSDAGSCGMNHDCGDDGFCRRSACAHAANCEGYCVNQLCFDSPGTCRPPVP